MAPGRGRVDIGGATRDNWTSAGLPFQGWLVQLFERHHDRLSNTELRQTTLSSPVPLNPC